MQKELGHSLINSFCHGKTYLLKKFKNEKYFFIFTFYWVECSHNHPIISKRPNQNIILTTILAVTKVWKSEKSELYFLKLLFI